MDKEVHCTFRCVVVFSGWTCLVANSVKRWKAALTSSVIGKTLTRYSGLLWQCFRYLPKKRYFSTYLLEDILISLYTVYYLHIYIYFRAHIYVNIYINDYHTAHLHIYIYTLSTLSIHYVLSRMVFRRAKVMRLQHFIWFLRSQVMYTGR